MLEENQVFLFKGKLDYRDEEMQLIVDKVSSPKDMNIEHISSGNHQEIYVPRKTNKETLGKLGKMLKANPGDKSILVIIPNGGAPKKMLLPYGVNWSEKLEKEVDKLLE